MERYVDVVWMSAAADPSKQESFTTNERPRWSGKNKRSGRKHQFKRFRGSATELDELVLNTVLDIHKKMNTGRCCAEEIGYRLNIRVDQIKHSFHRLNLRGILNQPSRSFAHDTNRNNFFYGPAHGWAPNIYTIRKLP
jgi:hypothetical protein